jgi:hypothetical protein
MRANSACRACSFTRIAYFAPGTRLRFGLPSNRAVIVDTNKKPSIFIDQPKFSKSGNTVFGQIAPAPGTVMPPSVSTL